MCCLQFPNLFLASLPLHPPSFSRCYYQLFTNALPLVSKPLLMLPPKKYSFQTRNEVRVHELQYCLCVSHDGRNFGEFNVSETEVQLPSHPTECAASDFVLSDYFLTNDLLLPNPQQYKHLSLCWSHHESEVYPTFQGTSQMTLRFC